MHSSMKHFAESNKEEDADGKEEPSKDVEMKGLRSVFTKPESNLLRDY